MVVYPCDIHKVSRLLTGKKGQLIKEVPSIVVMTNFGFGPFQRLDHFSDTTFGSYSEVVGHEAGSSLFFAPF